MRIMLMVSAVASLAACGEAAEQRDANEETSGPIAAETPIPVEPDGGIGDGALPLDEAQGIAANEIPERFHGVWDALTGTCARASDLRIEIKPKEIVFYESYGRVFEVERVEGSLAVSLAMEGEGETWEERLGFSLSDDGSELTQTHLIEVEGSPPPPVKIPPPLTRKKCPQ